MTNKINNITRVSTKDATRLATYHSFISKSVITDVFNISYYIISNNISNITDSSTYNEIKQVLNNVR